MHKMKVRADRYGSYKKEMDEYGMGADCVPVDLYGKRVTQGKDGNLQDIAEDIREFYDLKGDAGLS